MDRIYRCCSSLFECSKTQRRSQRDPEDSHQKLSQFEPESDPYSPYDSPETTSLLNVLLENPNYCSSLSTVDLELKHSASLDHKCRLNRYSVPNHKSKPELECFVVPSYGSHPRLTVEVKKRGSYFLKGVGDDSHIIQKLIKKDDFKELGEVQIMCDFERVKVAEFTKMIQDKMYDLKLNINCEKGRKYKHA